jgi:hypothetical protein
MWADGPRKYKLKVAALKIAETQAKWFQNGEEHKVPIFSEGRERGIIAEVYYMHHLPSSKGYVGLAYHGAHDRMQSHWNGRNREQDPSSVMMKESQTQFDWVCWPIERFAHDRRGHKVFHKRAAHREGWWASQLGTWWPSGFNVAGTGGYHKGGARSDWQKHRETFRKEWRRNTERDTEKARRKDK